jgi:hypothetical protein
MPIRADDNLLYLLMKRDRRREYHHKREKSTILKKKNSFDGGPREVDGVWALLPPDIIDGYKMAEF